MVPIWLLSIRKVRETVPREKLPLLGIAAAFSFLAMMFNIPLPGGTTGHAVGGTLIAILFGPYAACLAVSVALLIQALFFGDGGILAFGANCFNMAFVLPFTGYFLYHGLKKVIPSETIAAGIGAYAGINAAAFCAAVEFGIQPLLFTDGAGQALYCPYPLWISIPAMMIGHLTLFGLAEVVFTTGVLAYLRKTSPDLFHAVQAPSSSKSLFGLLAALIAATPLGLLAAGTAGANGMPKNWPIRISSALPWAIRHRAWNRAFPSTPSCRTTPSPACPMPQATSFRPSSAQPCSSLSSKSSRPSCHPGRPSIRRPSTKEDCP